MEDSAVIVISLGGSILVPARVDDVYLQQFVNLIKEEADRGKRFAIITGGGSISREYRDALLHVHEADTETLDMLGIATTRLNALLLRYAFDDYAESHVIFDPTEPIEMTRPIIIAGGWKPGHSSDGAAVGLAKTLGAKTILNLSNIDYVYTDDPRKNLDAEPIRDIVWEEFQKMFPTEWAPGANAPFDPIAAQMASDEDLEVVVMNGRNLSNLQNYLNDEEFFGTVISGHVTTEHLPKLH